MFATLLTILMVTLAFLALIGLMMWLTNKSVGAAITQRFQEAEFILEHHQAPKSWAKRQNIFAALMQRTSLSAQYGAANTKEAVMLRLDQLIAYFETSPFVQNEETRTLLLSQLAQEREQWAQKSLAEIMGFD